MEIPLKTEFAINKYIDDPNLTAKERVLSFEQTLSLVEEARGSLYIASTRGDFDIIHPGHTRYIEWLVSHAQPRAASLGKRLLVAVGVNSPEETLNHKGYRTNGRPVFDWRTRAEVIASLKSVHIAYVIGSDSQVQELKPDLFQAFTGSDRKPSERADIWGMAANGTEILIDDRQFQWSTTETIRRIRELEII